jgi:1,4-alpha-glucan branching enzyme
MRKSGRFALFFLIVICFVSGETIGQVRRQQVNSPEVNPDKTVIFRFRAPDAKEVKISVQFEKESKAMIRDSAGLWSITLGPVKPDIYPYSFIVDGIQVMDPNNVNYFPNERFKNSLVDIQGNPPLIHSLQDVPHGKIAYRYYNQIHST